MNTNPNLVRVVNEALEEFGDGFTSSDVLGSLEDLSTIADLQITDHKTMMRMRAVLTKAITNCSECREVEKAPVPDYVATTSTKEFAITIDWGLLISWLLYDTEVLTKMIRELSVIPEDGVLRVYSNLPFDDLGYLMMFEGVAIANALSLAKCKKVFQFGAEVTSSDLLIASRCDEIDVGDYAAIFIIKADKSSSVGGYVKEAYRELVRFVYKYWVEKGLFTADEITGLFANEAENSIALFGDEIKRRLNK